MPATGRGDADNPLVGGDVNSSHGPRASHRRSPLRKPALDYSHLLNQSIGGRAGDALDRLGAMTDLMVEGLFDGHLSEPDGRDPVGRHSARRPTPRHPCARAGRNRAPRGLGAPSVSPRAWRHVPCGVASRRRRHRSSLSGPPCGAARRLEDPAWSIRGSHRRRRTR